MLTLFPMGCMRPAADDRLSTCFRLPFAFGGFLERAAVVVTDGRALVVVPAHDKRRRKRFQDALTACNEQYGKALKRLAE